LNLTDLHFEKESTAFQDMSQQNSYKNVLDRSVAGYAGLGKELEKYLKETYGGRCGHDYDFQVTVGRGIVNAKRRSQMPE
jgi:hypothetical protein